MMIKKIRIISQDKLIIKSIAIYISHTTSNLHRCQAGATIERIPFNARHAVGDGDGGKFRATRERIISY